MPELVLAKTEEKLLFPDSTHISFIQNTKMKRTKITHFLVKVHCNYWAEQFNAFAIRLRYDKNEIFVIVKAAT